MLEDIDWVSWVLKLSQQRLGANYRFAAKILDDAGIRYHKGGWATSPPLSMMHTTMIWSIANHLHSNSGYFLWVDLSPYLPPPTPEHPEPVMRERVLAKRFRDAGINLATGEKFASEYAGWFRIVFTHQQEELKEGLRRWHYSSPLLSFRHWSRGHRVIQVVQGMHGDEGPNINLTRNSLA